VRPGDAPEAAVLALVVQGQVRLGVVEAQQGAPRAGLGVVWCQVKQLGHSP
jgi:acyl CoA:acetate/3-ketoacid CoA transferase alpha subunit